MPLCPELADGVGTGACRPRDQESIPHTVSKWASPQPNPLVAFEKTMARLTVNLVLSIAYLGRFLFFILAAAVVRFSKTCQSHLLALSRSRSALPAPSPGVYHATQSRSRFAPQLLFVIFFFFLRHLFILPAGGGVLSRMECCFFANTHLKSAGR